MGEYFNVSAWSVYSELCFKIVESILDCNHSVLKQAVIAQLHWEFCVQASACKDLVGFSCPDAPKAPHCPANI